MREWSVRELEAIEDDMRLVSMWSKEEGKRWLENEYDYAWFKDRIDIRAQRGERSIGRCDACPTERETLVHACVDEYYDDMGAPSMLGVTYLCGYHRNTNG